MALLQINAGDTISDAALREALAQHPGADRHRSRPIVIMVHGYKFDPAVARHDPHSHILAEDVTRSCWKARSWPRRLGLMGERGLGIAFGWSARGSIWEAYQRCSETAQHLAALMRRLHVLAPHRPLHIFAHSLGARIALLALREVPSESVARVILISGAAFRHEVHEALETPAGRTAELFSITGRENMLFDLLLRGAFPTAGPTIGRGVSAPNWLTLRLDRPAVLAGLGDLGYPIAPPSAPICHWSGYLRPGVFGLYRALLHRPQQTPMSLLRAQTAPPRASRSFRPLALPTGTAS